VTNRFLLQLFETIDKNTEIRFYFAKYSIGQEKEKTEEKYMNTYDTYSHRPIIPGDSCTVFMVFVS